MSETENKPGIVIDTNIWVEAALATLSPETANEKQLSAQRTVDYALKYFRIVMGEKTAKELARVLCDPHGITNDLNAVNAERAVLDLAPLRFNERKGYVLELSKHFPLSQPGKSPTRCEADKDDQMFLDMAFGNDVSLIVSRDRHLREVKAAWCAVLTPEQFNSDILRADAAPELISLRSAFNALGDIKAAHAAASKRVKQKAPDTAPDEAAVGAPIVPAAPSFADPPPRRRRASFSDPKATPDKGPEEPLKGAMAEKLAGVKGRLRKPNPAS